MGIVNWSVPLLDSSNRARSPRRKILIVDDESAMRSLLKRSLRQESYRVFAVGSGKQALELMEYELPDMVLLDLVLPQMSGVEVCRKMRQNEATSRIPVIMITGHGDASDEIAGFGLGADDFIVKPFSLEELKARVRAIFRRYGASHHAA